jgi:PAS domain S-box-containing protein
MKQMDESKISLNVLCLEDVLNDAHLINEMLVEAGYLVSMDIASEENEFLSFLKSRNYDIVLADYTLPGFDVYTALKLTLKLQPEAPFICVSGTINEDTALNLLKQGATDYILKDRLGRLAFAVRRALEGVRKQKEWKKTEEALKQANSELQNLHDNLDQAVFSVDLLHNKMLQVSIAHEAVFGFSQEAFLNNPMLWYEIIVPEDKPIVDSGYPVLFSGKNLHHEYRIVTADGQLRWIEAKMKPTLDTNGKLIRVDGIASNITERKKLEETLRESKAMYQAIFESTGTAIFISEESTNILMANKECFSILGYTPDELTGQKWIQYFAPESLEEMMKNHALRRQNPDLAPTKYEVKLVNKQGELRDVILEVGMIPNTKQSIVSILDITERKQAEEALVKLRKAIYTSGEAIFLTDLDGIFTFVNPAFTSLYGFSSEEIIGKATPRIINSGEAGKSFYEVFWSTLLKGDEVKLEILNKRKDGSLINIEASATPVIDEKKNIIGFLGIQHDISDRKHAEQELITAKEKAEESDRLKTAFLNNISHEIRTPFNGILGFLSIIQDEDLTTSERDEYIRFINQSADRLMQTINDIVEMAQIQTGQMKLSISDTNIKKLTDKLSGRFGTVAESNGLIFTIINDLPTEIVSIFTDGVKLKTILSNLIVNAIKFTKAGSIDIRIRKTDFYYEFSVKDTGIGISKNQQKSIFELFKQADVTNTRLFEGLGLGLSITKSYIEMLEGEIWLESEPGKGSTFYFTIPTSQSFAMTS